MYFIRYRIVLNGVNNKPVVFSGKKGALRLWVVVKCHVFSI
jgi:hypothetical protein